VKFDWIKSIPDYLQYFNEDHRLIIDLVGIDNYFKLFGYFSKTGLYFSNTTINHDQRIVISIIGYDNYLKLLNHFGKTGIYFSSSSVMSLKKAWAIKNRHVNYNDAARILEVSNKTIYNWRQEISGENYGNNSKSSGNYELFE
jgi:hypothetical protein